MEFKSEYYIETQIDSIIISYGFKKGKVSDKNIIQSNLKSQIYENNKLVISFNPLDFGNVLSSTILENGILYWIHNKDNLTIKILKSNNKNFIEYFKDGQSLIKFTDDFISENSFVREINNKKYYFENNKEILFIKKIKTKFISKLKKSKILVNNFITFDIETFVKDNILIPFCICIYDGEKTYYYFVKENNKTQKHKNLNYLRILK